jgi:hypothetical protein
MPVDFLSDGEAARYGRFAGAPGRAELEKLFFLDDADKAPIRGKRVRTTGSVRRSSVGRAARTRWRR